MKHVHHAHSNTHNKHDVILSAPKAREDLNCNLSQHPNTTRQNGNVDQPETCPSGRVATHHPKCYVGKDFAEPI